MIAIAIATTIRRGIGAVVVVENVGSRRDVESVLNKTTKVRPPLERIRTTVLSMHSAAQSQDKVEICR